MRAAKRALASVKVTAPGAVRSCGTATKNGRQGAETTVPRAEPDLDRECAPRAPRAADDPSAARRHAGSQPHAGLEAASAAAGGLRAGPRPRDAAAGWQGQHREKDRSAGHGNAAGAGGAGPGGAGAPERARWAKMACTARGSCTVAMTRRRPPQRGQARVALLEFKDRYNGGWLCARHGHQRPAQVREALGAGGVRGVGRTGGQSEGRRGSRFDLEEGRAISVCLRILVNRRPSRLPSTRCPRNRGRYNALETQRRTAAGTGS